VLLDAGYLILDEVLKIQYRESSIQYHFHLITKAPPRASEEKLHKF